jgi:hypothetical protein
MKNYLQTLVEKESATLDKLKNFILALLDFVSEYVKIEFRLGRQKFTL